MWVLRQKIIGMFNSSSFFWRGSKMRKYIYLSIILFIGFLSGCVSNQPKQAAIAKNCNFVTYSNYNDLVSKNPGKIPALTPRYRYFDGHSLLPFGSREKAVAEAEEKACASNNKHLLVVYDGEKLYSGSGPSIIGGSYYDYYLMPVKFTGTSSGELRKELEVWVNGSTTMTSFSGQHFSHLLEVAKDKKYSDLSEYFLGLAKKGRAFAVDVYVSYNGIGAKDNLIKWVKYHKNEHVKRASYKALINLGLTSDVEVLLKNESNLAIKKDIGMMLI